MKKGLISMLVLLLVGLQSVFAQSREISGVVTSADDGLSLPGVSVVVKGTTNGVSTNLDGKYALKVGADAKVLVFSFVGMQTQEIAINGKSTINVVLKSDAKDLDEVVVVGYGVTKKKAFTGAASTLGAEQIADKVEANPIKALEATVPGLQMTTSTGQPGAPSTIFIRGRSSVNSGTQPLYVIDGVPMESGSWGMRSNEGATSTPLSGLNPADIKSITILKDATATSIYGARAANGVIVVTTKSARVGSKTKVTVNSSVGWEEMPSFTDDYKSVNKDEYLELQYEGIANSGWVGTTVAEAKDQFWNGALWGLSGKSLGLTEDTAADVNWLDEITRKGFVQEHNISVQTAGEKETSPRMYISFGYLGNDAIIKGKDFEKYSFRLNAVQSPNKWLTYGINTALSYTETNMGASGGYFSDPITQAYMQAPITPVKTDKGAWNFSTVNNYNPVAQKSALGDKNNAKTYRAIITPNLTIKFLPELTLNSKLNLDLMYLDEFGYWSFLQPQGKDMRGMGEDGVNRQTAITMNNVLNYIKTFDDVHHLNVMVGQEIQKTNLFKTYLSGSNYPVSYLNNVALAATPGSASTSEYDLRLASFFSNVQYDFDNKYYLSASYRYDGSSRFGSNYKWAGFWSVGAKYRLTREDFMKSTQDWLTDLTIRSSYGTSGNQSVGNGWYAAQALYGYGWNYNSNGGSSREQVGNDDLKWEQMGKFNVGFDANLFDRFSLTFDYYYHKTTDMVFNMPLSRTTGMSSVYKNIGEMENKGVEISLNANVIKNDNFSWSSNLVASHNENKVLKLSTEHPIEGTYTIVEPGEDIYTFKMKEYAGVDAKTGKAEWYLNATGDEKTTNYNKAAKRYLGSASPKWQGSWTNNLKVGNFDFSLQLNYSLGGKIYGSNLRYDEQTGSAYNNTTTKYVYENRWQKPGDITDVPKFVWGDASNKHSSRYLMDGDYLKIQNIVLGYTLPKSLTDAIKLSKIRVYASASNVYTFTASNYRGFDPAGIGANGIQWWNYPLPRKFMFGVNINL